MSSQCPECHGVFSRKDVMLRHMRNKHNQINHAHVSPPTPMPSKQVDLPSLSQPNGIFFFKHPFTLACAGPTSSGKSYFIKEMLENRNDVISPPPQRIYVFYSEWQPLYQTMAENVPDVIFVRGIPDDIDSDTYFDRRVRNLAIFDDLMSDAASDTRIADIFTKKSHHRNLSVCLVLQNVYKQGKAMRDISLNSQYMILFKNPRDKQQISVLARQMYPGKTHKLLNMYEKATERPHGYLLIDLKSDTPECSRLRTNVLPTDPEQHLHARPVPPTHIDKLNSSISGIEIPEASQDEAIKHVDIVEPPSVQVGSGLTADVKKKYAVKAPLEKGIPGHLAVQSGSGNRKRKRMDVESSPEHLFPTCDDCGALFAYDEDLERHKRKHCPEKEDEPPRKKIKVEREEPVTFQKQVWSDLFRKQISAELVGKIKARRDKYRKQGYSKVEAWDMARHDFIPDMRKRFREMYTKYLLDAYYLNHDPVHKKVKETINQLRMEHGMDILEAIKQAVKMRKHLFEKDVIPDPLDKKEEQSYPDAQTIVYDSDSDEDVDSDELSEEENPMEGDD